MNGKLVETSMGCVGVSKETVVNLEVKLIHRVVKNKILTFRTLALRRRIVDEI